MSNPILQIIKKVRMKYSPYIRWKKDLMTEIRAGSIMIETKMGPIEYTIHGNNGPYVAVMHGGPGGYDQTAALFSSMYDKGFRILSWSRPGYIRTPLEVGRTFQEQADAFAALLDALNIEKTAVLAYSAGGPPAIFFAGRHPKRTWALILECAVSRKYEVNNNNIREQIFFGHLMFHDPSLWLADVIATHAPWLLGRSAIKMESSLEEDEVLKLLRHIMNDERKEKVLMDLIKSMSPARLRKKGMKNDLKQLAQINSLPLGDIQSPTLVIHGTNDLDVGVGHAENAAETIPGAELYLVKEGFHILAVADNADEITEKKIRFLQMHAPW